MARKTVVVELRIQMLREFDDSDDAKFVEFFFNNSSHCISNEIAALHDWNDVIEGCCDSCGRTVVHYLRDANPEDIETLKPPVKL